MRLKLLFFVLMFSGIVASLEAKIQLKDKTSFKIGFYLSEIQKYSYEKKYVDDCRKNLENFGRATNDPEVVALAKELEEIKSKDFIEYSKKVKKKSDLFYDRLSGSERIHYLYGAHVSSIGFELLIGNNTSRYVNSLKELHEYLVISNNESAHLLDKVIVDLDNTTNKKSIIKSNLYSILNIYSLE